MTVSQRSAVARWVAPTLLEWGSDAQKARFIPPTLRHEIRWCQGYSEPGAGSDLASLQSRAELVGGEWVIHGHKPKRAAMAPGRYHVGRAKAGPARLNMAGIIREKRVCLASLGPVTILHESPCHVRPPSTKPPYGWWHPVRARKVRGWMTRR